MVKARQREASPQLNGRLTLPPISQRLASAFNDSSNMKRSAKKISPNPVASFVASIALVLMGGCATSQNSTWVEPGFKPIFNGENLDGWVLMGAKGSYGVTNGAICCNKGSSSNLFTEKEYDNFALRFEFKLEEGSNNGIGIRAPLEGDAAYLGMEIQVLDEVAAEKGKWGKLKDDQFHGSIYGVAAAKKGALKPAGEWNSELIVVNGRQITVVLNDVTILDHNINDVTDPAKIAKHPGLFRERGHIGFLGHGDPVAFRNLRVKELPRTTVAALKREGFTSLFNGDDLTGWKGLVGSPSKRAAMTAADLAIAQSKADDLARKFWKVEGGALVYRGTNYDNLCSAKDYVNFELVADWKIEANADSGFYLRGTPQVQIWDPFTEPVKGGSEVGSGGLYNNRTNTSKPLMVADKPVGQWNQFRIVMAGEKVHVFLNDQLVVNGTTLENYWQRDLPLLPFGSIELQAHKSVVWFKNLYIRELHSQSR